jgi:hypothetical protein
MKEFFRELHNRDLEAGSPDSMLVRYASMFLVHMRAIHDPEIARINSQFTQLFFKVE